MAKGKGDDFGADPEEQLDRIERKFKDLAEAFLDGKASIEITPLAPDATVADQVGSVTVVNGFNIRLRRD